MTQTHMGSIGKLIFNLQVVKVTRKSPFNARSLNRACQDLDAAVIDARERVDAFAARFIDRLCFCHGCGDTIYADMNQQNGESYCNGCI